MTYRLGLTGSIGMGKSTTAQMFRDLGVPVWDADETVHRLYALGGGAVDPVAALVPDAVVGDAVDRARLKVAIANAPDLLDRLEDVVHPLVAADRAAFLARHADTPLVVLDIPLLYETGAEAQVDGVLVVSTDAATQRDRVLARPGMTEALVAQILSRQMPDVVKRARADHLIATTTLEQTRAAVAELVHALTKEHLPDA